MPSLASQLLQSRLAGEGGLEPFIDLLDAFAGKPAPTGEVSVSSTAKSS
jgi:hypothetical protein